MILADALAYAVEREPERVLDLATLTGACIVALGLKVAGLFSNNDAFSKDLTAASRKTGERVWRLPLHDDFKEQLKSSVADWKSDTGIRHVRSNVRLMQANRHSDPPDAQVDGFHKH